MITITGMGLAILAIFLSVSIFIFAFVFYILFASLIQDKKIDFDSIKYVLMGWVHLLLGFIAVWVFLVVLPFYFMKLFNIL
jgi:hypothetical protein